MDDTASAALAVRFEDLTKQFGSGTGAAAVARINHYVC
jgi:hypothetical protein